ncbi:MAG: ATPase [Actinomycetes bacterium]|jgi:cell division septum initiation protein DivIVA|nr:ATPase [Actinomycetes bacterium]
MDIEQLVNRIEEVIDSSKSVPLSQSKMVDPDAIYDIIDEIRNQYPEDLKQARWIVKQRQEMIEEAEREVNRVLEDAQERARDLVDETQIVREAQSRAAEIAEDARADAREVRLGAEDYADEMLANLEVNLGKLLTSVQRGRDRLQGKGAQG